MAGQNATSLYQNKAKNTRYRKQLALLNAFCCLHSTEYLLQYGQAGRNIFNTAQAPEI